VETSSNLKEATPSSQSTHIYSTDNSQASALYITQLHSLL
jgi:hypothetical protein